MSQRGGHYILSLHTRKKSVSQYFWLQRPQYPDSDALKETKACRWQHHALEMSPITLTKVTLCYESNKSNKTICLLDCCQVLE